MLEDVRLFLQKVGLILMAATWLSFSFGHAQEHGFSLTRQIGKGTPVEVVYAVRQPSQTVQFHQLRLSGWGYWFSKFFGWESVEPGFLSAQTRPDSGTWLITSAPRELLETWQFTRRAALLPRSPCLA